MPTTKQPIILPPTPRLKIKNKIKAINRETDAVQEALDPKKLEMMEKMVLQNFDISRRGLKTRKKIPRPSQKPAKRGPSSSIDKKGSPENKKLLTDLVHLQIRSHPMVTRSNNRRSRDNEKIPKKLDTGQKDKMVMPILLPRKRLPMLMLTKRKTETSEANQMTRKRLRPMSQKILFTKILWNSKRLKSSSPNGRNTVLATGEKVAAKHLSPSKPIFLQCLRNY